MADVSNQKYVLAAVLVPADDAGKIHFPPNAVHVSNVLTLDELRPENFEHMLPALIDQWLIENRALSAEMRGRPLKAH